MAGSGGLRRPEGLSTMVIESIAVGGQAGTSSRIENYLGFPAGLSGQELAASGPEVRCRDSRRVGGDVSLVLGRRSPDQTCRRAHAEGARRGDCDRCPVSQGGNSAVARVRRHGVYYSATEVEARVCSKRVAVVGGGNSAGQAAIFLSRRGMNVLLLIRGSSLKSSMSRYLIDEIIREPAITIRHSTSVVDLLGTDRLDGIVIETDGERSSEGEVDGLFSFIGAEPNSGWLDPGIQLDNDGFVATGAEIEHSQRLPLETSRLAVFAVGDVRHGSTKRVATAVG